VRANSLKPEEKLKPKELNHKAIILNSRLAVPEKTFSIL